jgi:hypothetical protein
MDRKETMNSQWILGIALIALMAMTRGHHFASIDILPSASWAVFFLAGFYLRASWMLPLLMAQAFIMDFMPVLTEGVTDAYCLTPAYWVLVPAYSLMWFAGRLAKDHAAVNLFSITRFAVIVVLATLITQLISSGGYYVWSGKFPDPSMAEFADRIVKYLPKHAVNIAFYLTVSLCIHWVVRESQQRAPVEQGVHNG